MAVKHSLPPIKSFELEKFKMIAAKSSIQIIFSDNDFIKKKSVVSNPKMVRPKRTLVRDARISEFKVSH